ncbi:hypothetical protein [Nostoc sp.]
MASLREAAPTLRATEEHHYELFGHLQKNKGQMIDNLILVFAG